MIGWAFQKFILVKFDTEMAELHSSLLTQRAYKYHKLWGTT